MTVPTFLPSGQQIAAQRDFLVEIDGIPGYWKMMSGAKRSSAITKEYDGGALEPQNLAAPPEMDNLTLTRGYRPDDAPYVRAVWLAVGRGVLTIHCHDVDAGGDIIVGPGHSRSYPGCRIASCTRPDVDASSGSAGNWVIEVAPGREVV